MKNKNNLFSKTEIIGTSIVIDSIKIELVQQTMFKGKQKCVVYHIMLNGDKFTSIDNRRFAFYLLNDFDFKQYLKICNDLDYFVEECENV